MLRNQKRFLGICNLCSLFGHLCAPLRVRSYRSMIGVIIKHNDPAEVFWELDSFDPATPDAIRSSLWCREGKRAGAQLDHYRAVAL